MDRALVIGVVLTVVALVARSLSVNTYLRQRAFMSAWLFATYTAITFAAARHISALEQPEIHRQLAFLLTLLLTFGIVNLLISSLVNPWRADRLPERFPNIVQNAMIIGLFGVAMTVLRPGDFMATTAVGAVVFGLALQDTLGNLFAGLAIQLEKPFRVGHWIGVSGQDGRVAEITWRATRIRTKSGNSVILPNSVMARETITNYSVPTPQLRLEVEVSATYDAAPGTVKAVIRQALADEPLIDHSRDIDVLLVDFAASSIVYRIRVWMTDFAADEILRDAVRSRVYYAFRRHQIVIPYPIQVEMHRVEKAEDEAHALTHRAAALHATPIFATLDARTIEDIARGVRLVQFGAHETVVREGQPGESMFVVARGEARVTIAGANGAAEEVARLQQGAFFGEMSLLTGDPRTATVVAATDCDLFELPAEAFREIVAKNPAIVEMVTDAVTKRREELSRHRAAAAPTAAQEEPAHRVLARIRSFLRLSST